LEKTSIYSKFLSEKMESQQKERREKAEQDTQKKTVKVAETAKVDESTAEEAPKKKRGRPPSKRKQPEEGYSIADYVQNEVSQESSTFQRRALTNPQTGNGEKVQGRKL
jgi:hypothetical protein